MRPRGLGFWQLAKPVQEVGTEVVLVDPAWTTTVHRLRLEPFKAHADDVVERHAGEATSTRSRQ